MAATGTLIVVPLITSAIWAILLHVAGVRGEVSTANVILSSSLGCECFLSSARVQATFLFPFYHAYRGYWSQPSWLCSVAMLLDWTAIR